MVELGRVELLKGYCQEQLHQLQQNLLLSGLEVINDKKEIIIEKVKNVIMEMMHNKHELYSNESYYISEKLQLNYSYLSKLFSEVQGMTIKQYIISNKIEKVKEQIIYSKLTLTEIADQMNYSSVAYLCRQFKKTTGLSPTCYKNSIKIDSSLHTYDIPNVPLTY